MKAQYHPNSTDQVEVEILDIFVDKDGQPSMMFLNTDGHVTTAPIRRFTELTNGTGPVKRSRRSASTGDDPASATSEP
ncbi:MAG: hypothetical protein JXA58_06680 [Dehalococcoidia bacterium]|nr:hypothetical protein [Dehalococcoidia bacterium]